LNIENKELFFYLANSIITIMSTFLLKNTFFFCLIILSANSLLKGQVIQTVAGGIGEGALPQNFAVDNPNGLIIDKKGSVYFYDDLPNQIKKIDGTTGRIKTVVGTGGVGVSGDNDSALKAQIVRVGKMALDSAGNLYFSGTTNNRIRKVNRVTGIITTVAGSGIVAYTKDGELAYDHAIGLVQGIVFDKVGNMYFSESTNNIVRKVDKSTGLLSTYAGLGTTASALGDGGLATAATLNYPGALIIDDSSNIYIADLYQQRIRKVSALTGIITTVAGNGTQGYSGDNGLATAAKINYISSLTFDGSGNLILGDANESVIRKVNKQTGIITTIAGTGIGGYGGDGSLAVNALLQDPMAMDKDSLGNIIFCDTYNNRIRKINTSGIINTLVGNGTSQGFIGLGAEAIYAQNLFATSIVIDSVKNIYTTNSNRICKTDAQTGIITAFAGVGVMGFSGDNGPASMAKFNNPAGIILDKAGNIIFIDRGNYRIRKINAATQIITTIAGTGTQGYSGDGGLATAADLGGITSMDIDSTGNLYLCDVAGPQVSNNRIRKINAATGIITTYAGGSIAGFSGDGGPVDSALFQYPSKMRVDGKGNVYIYDEQNKRIRKVDAKTGIIQTVLGGGTTSLITEGSKALEVKYSSGTLMEFDASQNLYISVSGSSIIYKVDAQTGLITKYAGTGVEGFSGDGLAPAQAQISASISSLKIDKSGNAWFADNIRIRAISNTAPTVLSQPKNLIACINNTISFDIKASCDSAYQWQLFQGGVYSNIQNNSLFSGAQTNSLSISILDSSLNNDSFRCVVYGPMGTTISNAALLRIRPVQSVPVITGPANACQGQTFLYSIPNISNHSYKWNIKYGSYGSSKNNFTAIFGLVKQDTIYLLDSIDGTTCSVSTFFPVKLSLKPSPAFTYTQAGGKLTFYPTQTGLMSFDWVINKITSNDQNPKVEFTSNGTYSVFLKVTDSLNCYRDTTVNVLVTTVGFNETSSTNKQVNLYPNPVKDILTI